MHLKRYSACLTAMGHSARLAVLGQWIAKDPLALEETP